MVRRGGFAVLAVVIALSAWPAAAEAQFTPRDALLSHAADVSHAQPPPVEQDSLIGAWDDVVVARVPTLVDNLDQLAGHRVLIKGARVARVYEPRVFSLRSERRRPALPPERDELVVLVEPGQALVEEGISVVVRGILRTDYGAWMSGDVPWLKELDREILERVSGRPVVIATSIQTPDGVELLTRR